MKKLSMRIWLVAGLFATGVAVAAMTSSSNPVEKPKTGHADVGDCAWGQCCGANPDGSPNNYCRWVAGVDCCDSGAGKLAKHGTHSGDATSGWDYDCTANDCPGEDDCAEKEAQLHPGL